MVSVNNNRRLIPDHLIKNTQIPAGVVVITPQPQDVEMFVEKAKEYNNRLGYKAYDWDEFGQIKIAGRRTHFRLVNFEASVQRSFAAGAASIRLAPPINRAEAVPDWYKDGPGVFCFPEMEIRIFAGYSKNLYQDPEDWKGHNWWRICNPQLYPIFWGVVDAIECSGSGSSVYFSVHARDKTRYFIDSILYRNLSAIVSGSSTQSQNSLPRFRAHQDIVDQLFYGPRLKEVAITELNTSTLVDGDLNYTNYLDNDSGVLEDNTNQTPLGFNEYPDGLDLNAMSLFGGNPQTRKPLAVDFRSILGEWLSENESIVSNANTNAAIGYQGSYKEQLDAILDVDGAWTGIQKPILDSAGTRQHEKVEGGSESTIPLIDVAKLIIGPSRIRSPYDAGVVDSGYYRIFHGDEEFSDFFRSQAIGSQQVGYFIESFREMFSSQTPTGNTNTSTRQTAVPTSFDVTGQFGLDVIKFLSNSEQLPTEFFMDQRTGHFFYVPIQTGFRPENYAPHRVYTFQKTVEVNLPDGSSEIYTPNVQEFRSTWSTLGYKNNFHIHGVESSTNESAPLTFHFNVVADPEEGILPNYMAPRHHKIADPTINNRFTGDIAASIVAASVARVLTKDIRGIEIAIDGDPLIQPGMSAWCFNMGLFNNKTSQIDGFERNELSTQRRQDELNQLLYNELNIQDNTGNREAGQVEINTIAKPALDGADSVSSETLPIEPAGFGSEVPPSRQTLTGNNTKRIPGIILRVQDINHIFCLNLRQGFRTELLLQQII